jgi:Zn-dependent protease
MNEIQTLIIYAIPVLFAITLHEFAHGFVALKNGDGSAKMLGRLTLNPIKHIDPIGTIAVPIVLYFSFGFVFGWAKPVPVNFDALRSKKIGTILVALAGPFANLLMSIFWLFVLFISEKYNLYPLITMAIVGIQVNLLLMIFNLIPLPPLDGSRVISVLLPGNLSYLYNRLENYSLYILGGLLILDYAKVIDIFGFLTGAMRIIYNFMIELL